VANLDSRSKRSSSVGILLAFILAPPLPDGTLGDGDRQQIAVSYSGILAGAAAALAFILDLNTRLRALFDYTYSRAAMDNSTGYVTYAATITGDANNRLARIIDDATP